MSPASLPRDDAWLLLWDIDGTLLLQASEAHATAVRTILREVHGIAEEQQLVGSAAGKTDGQICREILVASGISDARIDEHAATVIERTCAIYDPGDLLEHVSPGLPDLLAELHDRDDVVQSLVTGNFEPIARRKLQAARLDRWFNAQIGGGFGSDHEERVHLPATARARAGAALRKDGAPWPVERTIVIGDTPRDVACARHDGVHAVGVSTGPFGPDELAEADAVAHDAPTLRAALLGLIEASAPAAG